jgi:ATP-dependent DNA helicase DinG
MSEEVHSNVIPASRLKSRVAELLSKPSLGLVAEVRPSQLKMSAGVEDVITNGGLYAVEAPVGSGKTYAYLLPALLAGRRVLVVTPKKSLQDQIVGKDLPALQKAIGHTIPVVLLKGKGNYTCQLVVANKQLTNTAQGAAEYAEFILNSRYGDRGDWQGQVPMWWGKASAENCVGNSCPYAKSCGYMRLKQELSSAQVVVGNHHLLGFDLVWGAGKIAAMSRGAG